MRGTAVRTGSEPESVTGEGSPTCPVCSGPVQLEFRLPDRGIYRCRRSACTLRFAFPQPNDQALKDFYNHCYYGEGSPVYENTPEAYLHDLVTALDRQIGGIRGKSVLDFGCGIGRLLGLFTAAGAKLVEGIESDADARAVVQDSLGLEIQSSVEELRHLQPDARYDLITMKDVIEHVRSPVQTLMELRGLLAPGAWLLVSTPDVESARARLVGMRWDNYQNPTHLFYFSARSLCHVLRLVGFTELVVWQPLLGYPGHSPPRKIIQAVLQHTGLDGALHVLARTRALQSAGR